MRRFAHSIPGTTDCSGWEPLEEHLRAVALHAKRLAAAFGGEDWAEAAGLLHDIGKVSQAYQDYIRRAGQELSKGPDHSTAGAVQAQKSFPAAGWLLAFVIAGHHAGLADGVALKERLKKKLEPYTEWEAYTGALPTIVAPKLKPSSCPYFSAGFFVRMVFSCLVDADFLETEAFYARVRQQPLRRGGFADIATLRGRLSGFMERMHANAPTTPLNNIRRKILDHALKQSTLPPGLFTMTVPTGGGKTFTSLSFALEHAAHHGLRRVIYVAPYTSIIEQTAGEFSKALGDDEIVEHHSNFEWDKAEDKTDEQDPDGLKKLRHATENWDAPVIVTTAVQFFESLFAARVGACRKLHNIAQSVIVLDEAQTLPLQVLYPCLAALEELTLNYGASVVLCTATQPAWRQVDGALPASFKGFAIGPERELAPDPASLFAALQRVKVEVLEGKTEDAQIVSRFAQEARMLCIVNTRAHARDLFEQIRHLPGARHLTTLMCAAHRKVVLAEIREDLAAGRPVRLVATSLIEAGVDLDFDEVWRAETGLDSIAQAAGRCNREGKMNFGRVVVFAPAERATPKALIAFKDAAYLPLRMDNPLGLQAVKAYFKGLYYNRGAEWLDALKIDEQVGVLSALQKSGRDVPFDSVATAFKLIDETMRPVIVNWRGKIDKELEELEYKSRPSYPTLRTLQRYTVPVSQQHWAALRACGGIQPISKTYGERFMVLVDEAQLYDEVCGLKIDDLTSRSAEQNIM